MAHVSRLITATAMLLATALVAQAASGNPTGTSGSSAKQPIVRARLVGTLQSPTKGRLERCLATVLILREAPFRAFGAAFDFTIYDDHSWRLSADGAAGRIQKNGSMTAEEVEAIIAELKKAGLGKSKAHARRRPDFESNCALAFAVPNLRGAGGEHDVRE